MGESGSAAPFYRGRRVGHKVEVWNPRGGLLDPATGIRDHSPSGFEWGYGGSGPAQLALALLFDWHLHYGPLVRSGARRRRDARIMAMDTYQLFKWAVVAQLPRQWDMHEALIGDFLEVALDRDAGVGPTWDQWRELMRAGGWLVAVPWEGGEQ